MYLFLAGLDLGSGCRLFSSGSDWGLLSNCNARASHWSGFCLFLFFLSIYILLKYSWLTVFQVHSKVIQLYVYTYITFEIIFHYRLLWDFPVAQMVKNLPAVQETQVPSLGREDPLEKEMATHFSIIAWRIPCTEEPGRLWGHRESDTTKWLTHISYY